MFIICTDLIVNTKPVYDLRLFSVEAPSDGLRIVVNLEAHILKA